MVASEKWFVCSDAPNERKYSLPSVMNIKAISHRGNNGGLARRHAVALKIEKPGAKGCLGGIASAGWLEDHQIQSFSTEKLFELCKKTLLFLEF